jgi:hypothetical protein
MLKKRILILSLSLLFLVSTTGLPVTYHLCQMMGQKSLDVCEVCTIKLEVVEPSCCSEDIMEYPVTISSENSICCQDEFVYNKVEDQFLFSKSDVYFFSTSVKLVQTTALLPPSVDFSTENSFHCDSSPPFLINPKIHITNLSLLI